MLDLCGRVDRLAAAVREADLVIEIFFEERLDRNVSVAIDRGREDGTAVLTEMIGEVRAAAEEAHPNGRARDHHRVAAGKCGGREG